MKTPQNAPLPGRGRAGRSRSSPTCKRGAGTRPVQSVHRLHYCGSTVFRSGAHRGLSGIGDPEHLKQLSIPVRVDLPGVGENFHDHSLVIGSIGVMDRPGPGRGNMTEVGLFWGSLPGDAGA